MSLLMDTQTNRFWARVDFLATGEIVLHIPEECELPIRVLVSRGGRSTEYEPNSSEKPNNCEDCANGEGDIEACGYCRHGDLYEPKDEPKTQMKTQNSNLTFEKRTMRDCYNCKRYETEGECIECNFEPKDEPQTDIHGLTDCDFCKGKNCEDCEGGKDEPQTERSE